MFKLSNEEVQKLKQADEIQEFNVGDEVKYHDLNLDVVSIGTITKIIEKEIPKEPMPVPYYDYAIKDKITGKDTEGEPISIATENDEKVIRLFKTVGSQYDSDVDITRVIAEQLGIDQEEVESILEIDISEYADDSRMYASLKKKAGKIPGIPDGTGPYGKGLGPGKGLGLCRLDGKWRLINKKKLNAGFSASGEKLHGMLKEILFNLAPSISVQEEGESIVYSIDFTDSLRNKLQEHEILRTYPLPTITGGELQILYRKEK